MSFRSAAENLLEGDVAYASSTVRLVSYESANHRSLSPRRFANRLPATTSP
jgi:hypothetical protein